MKVYIVKMAALLCSAACMLTFASCSDKESSTESVISTGTELTTTAEEADLGEYVIGEKGVKLYYDPQEYPPELMSVLEKYFISFSQGDYESYAECVYPDYITEMNRYLEADYGYDLTTSFSNQCENLQNNAGGEFRVSRIKAELPEEDGSEEYLTSLGEFFGTDFYGTVMENSDAVYDMIFYVMAEADGEETLLLSEFEIVFAEKDGKFYTFG